MDPNETREILADLASDDADVCASMLLVLAQDPTGVPGIIDAVRAHLSDTRPCSAQAGFFAEVRWHAAHALAAELRAAGSGERVRLEGVVAPVAAGALMQAADEAFGGSYRAPLAERFDRLRREGRLATRTLEL
jgi:hypothetical protein